VELLGWLLVENEDDAFLHQLYALPDLVGSNFRLGACAGPGYLLEERELAGEEVEHLAV
jgi:hypothetical protein